MARNGIKNTAKLLTNPAFSVKKFAMNSGRRCMSDMVARQNDDHKKIDKEVLSGPGRGMWVPHPRTGIYFPIGQEWVMEDVPNDAASFETTFWLRSNEGVDDDHHDKDELNTHSFMHHNPN